jgi:hypothetical protein
MQQTLEIIRAADGSISGLRVVTRGQREGDQMHSVITYSEEADIDAILAIAREYARVTPAADELPPVADIINAVCDYWHGGN